MSDNHLTILVVEPGKPPYPRQIPDTLQAMQDATLALYQELADDDDRRRFPR